MAACFNIVFGLIAVLCSLQSDSAYQRGDVTEARERGRSAFKLSIAGIVCTIVTVIVIIVVYVIVVVGVIGGAINSVRN